VVDWDGLENRSRCKPTVGSNPTPSAADSLIRIVLVIDLADIILILSFFRRRLKDHRAVSQAFPAYPRHLRQFLDERVARAQSASSAKKASRPHLVIPSRVPLDV
jgi:hypothetical protein